MRKKRKAGVATLAILLTTAPLTVGSASALTPPKQIGIERTSTVGIPSSVRAGSTMAVHSWYVQNSYDREGVVSFDMVMWGPKVGNFYTSPDNVTVQFLDPVTHRWHTSRRISDNAWDYTLPSNESYLVLPNRWTRQDFRIIFGKTARPGLWHFVPEIPGTYSLVNAKGQDDWAYLGTSQPTYTVTVRR